MRRDRPREPEKAEQAGATAIDLRDAAHQANDLRDDEDQIEDRARADRGDYGYALGRGGDFRLRLGVE